jgi:uncharacterized membrane protein YeiH
MPERRSKDRKNSLLTAAAVFLLTAVLSVLAASRVLEHPVLLLGALGLTVLAFCGALVAIWVWWDVR